jgi:hypothetical protein
MVKKQNTKEYPAKRKFALRRDATVAAGQRRIEADYELPRGSVRLHLKNGKYARANMKIETLLADWRWWD